MIATSEQAKETVEFYCVKCRAKKDVPFNRTEDTFTKNSKRIFRASCPDCGTHMVKFVKRQAP